MTVTIPAQLRDDIPELPPFEVPHPVIHAPETSAPESASSGSPEAPPSGHDADARTRLRADIALAALRSAGYKLPIKTQVISREEAL